VSIGRGSTNSLLHVQIIKLVRIRWSYIFVMAQMVLIGLG